MDSVDLEDIPCYAINGATAEYMIGLVKKAMTTHTLLVFLFHGVGGGHSLNVDLHEHSLLIHYLRQQKENIWVPTLLDAAKYIRSHPVATAAPGSCPIIAVNPSNICRPAIN